MKLDKKQGYGFITGDASGAVFEQNGRVFGADGEEIVPPAPPVAPSADSKPADPPAADPPADKPNKTEAKKGGGKKGTAPAPAAVKSPLDSQLAAQGLQ